MHELAIARSISAIATRAAQGRPVAVVELDIGQLRQVVPASLVSCWSIVSQGTVLERSRLAIRSCPAILRCRDCGAETAPASLAILRCAGCASAAVDVVSGQEMVVSSLVLEDSDGTLSSP